MLTIDPLLLVAGVRYRAFRAAALALAHYLRTVWVW